MTQMGHLLALFFALYLYHNNNKQLKYWYLNCFDNNIKELKIFFNIFYLKV